MKLLSQTQKQTLENLEFVSIVSGVSGALLIALNLAFSKYGFILFLISSLVNIKIGRLTGLRSVLWLSVIFTFTNIVGIARWFV